MLNVEFQMQLPFLIYTYYTGYYYLQPKNSHPLFLLTILLFFASR